MEDKPDPRRVFASYDEYLELKDKVRQLANLEADQSELVYDLTKSNKDLKRRVNSLRAQVLTIILILGVVTGVVIKKLILC